MLKLWGRTNSINVQKVCWMIGELAIPCERVDAGMRHGLVGESWYGDLNPNRLVPVIRDGDFVLWESNTILRYLATKYAPGTWVPMDPENRALTDQWLDWQQTTLMSGLSPLFLGLIRTPPAERDAAALARAAASVTAAMTLLDRRLAGRSAIVGDRLTVADVAIGCGVHRWYALPVERPPLADLAAWYGTLVARPAFAAHVMLPLS